MKKFIPVYVRVPVLFALVFMALEFFIDSGDKPAFIKYPLVSVFLGVFLFIQIAIEIVIQAIDKVTYAILTDEQKAKLAEADALDYKESAWFKKLKGFFIKGKSIEEEGEITLHHNYDGIQELDNVLPPWWVKLFYVTIIFALVYLVRFHIMGDKNQAQEFEQEMADAKVAYEEYKKTAKDLVDASNVTQLTDPADLEKGKAIFQERCAACHRTDAGGQIGPNLTDEYWILGGGIKNVFTTITEGGRPDKGMISWKNDLKPSERQEVASYVLSLQGSNPKEPKEPQGDLWKEEAKPGDETK